MTDEPRIKKEWKFECQRCGLERSGMTKVLARSVLDGHLKSREHYESELREAAARAIGHEHGSLR